MSVIFGQLGLNDTERVWQATQGQGLIFDAVNQYVARVNAELQGQIGLFVENTTTNHKERFKLPGGGRLQKLGFDPQGKPAPVRAYGGWDVAYPLEEYGSAVGGSRVGMAYMTVGDLDRHVRTVTIQNAATMRFEILKAIFKNTTTNFVDPMWGTLTVQPLANGDSVTFPPVIGSEAEATDTHYLESGYIAANISDTNNPLVTIEAELVEHFGKSQGNDNVAVFINSAQKAKVEDLTDYIELPDNFIIPGLQTATLTGLPARIPATARVVGRTNGCWVVEWEWIPANYMVGIHLDAPAPLRMRVDPADTGLGSGLQLIAQEMEHPFETSYWSNRFGIGVANRLNGVVMELGTGGTYDIPAAYA